MSSLRIFVDADVIFAGATATGQGASLIILRLAEITLLDAVTSEQAVTEVERNLAQELPQALPAFRLLVDRCLQVVPDPAPADLLPYVGAADPKDLSILVAALQNHCTYLLTHNTRHFHPGHPAVMVLRPGDLLQRFRDLLVRLNH